MKKIILLILINLLTLKIYASCNLDKEECLNCNNYNNNYSFSYLKNNDLNCSKQMYVYGDFLYFNYYENLSYASIINNDINKSEDQIFKPGFRVGFASKFFQSNFLLNANWTYVRIKRKSEIKLNTDDILGTLLKPDFANIMSSASSKISGDFNTLDVNINVPFYVSRYFTTMPIFGIRAAWISKDFLARYFIDNTKSEVTHKNDYRALGLLSGYEGNLLITNYLYFYGKAMFSCLFGKTDVSQDHKTSLSPFRYDIQESYYNVKPNGEISLGLAFSKLFNKEKHKLSLKLGYEFHKWWNQNELRLFLDSNPSATKRISDPHMTLNGYTFSALLDF